MYIGLFIYSPKVINMYIIEQSIEISWWILWIVLVLRHFQTFVTKSWFTTLFSMYDSWYLILSLFMEIQIGSELCTLFIFRKILEVSISKISWQKLLKLPQNLHCNALCAYLHVLINCAQLTQTCMTNYVDNSLWWITSFNGKYIIV